MTNSTKVLLDTKGGNNMLYLPLDKLMQTQEASKRSAGLTEENLNNVVDQVVNRMQRSGVRQGEGRR